MDGRLILSSKSCDGHRCLRLLVSFKNKLCGTKRRNIIDYVLQRYYVFHIQRSRANYVDYTNSVIIRLAKAHFLHCKSNPCGKTAEKQQRTDKDFISLRGRN